jgi:ABC-2 type transport system ATP-binding protein
MKKIEINDISYSYSKDRYIYKNFSLNVVAGDKIGVIGPNGCGKSTLMNIISGFLVPQSGTIMIDGINYKFENDNLRSKFGVVPQEYALIEEITVEENIRFFSILNKIKGKELEEAVIEALKFTKLEDVKNKKVSTFSGGMKRRLNIALSLVHNPEIIILDEPTVGVDPHSRNFLLEKINEINVTDKVIFYVSHYMKEIEKTCNKILILDDGKVIAFDYISNILDSNKSSYVIVEGAVNSDGSYDVQHGGNTAKISGFKQLSEAVEFAEKNNLRIIAFKEGDLEDVFVKLTGKSLRD